MNAKEAYELLKKNFPDRDFNTCVEFDSVFAFSSAKPTDDPQRANIRPSWSVNKLTGLIEIFNPLKMPIEEYKNGVKVDSENYLS